MLRRNDAVSVQTIVDRQAGVWRLIQVSVQVVHGRRISVQAVGEMRVGVQMIQTSHRQTGHLPVQRGRKMVRRLVLVRLLRIEAGGIIGRLIQNLIIAQIGGRLLLRRW